MSTLVSLPGATPVAAPDYQSLERPLNFTESAAARVKSLIQEEGNPDLALRVYIEAAAVPGFQYGFEFDENRAETTWRYRPAG
jgi:iron-sulfur cluster insertion protein